MKKTLSDILNESVMSNAGYALHRVVKKDFLLIRLMWLISLLLLSALCSFLIVKTVGNYLNYEVVTNIKIVNENPSPFPTISICNLKPFDGSYVEKFLMQIDSKLKKTDIEAEDFVLNYHSYAYRYLIMSNLFDLNKNDTERKLFGKHFKDFIYLCMYGLKYECNESDFEWFYDFYYGGCYRFNPKETIKSYKKGKVAGIHMEIDVLNNKNNISWLSEEGVQLFIHNKSQKISFNQGIYVPVEKSTNIVIKRIFSNKIEKPYSNCVENSDLYDSKYFRMLNKANLIYRQSDCFEMCFSDYALEKCECRDGSTIDFFSEPICKTALQIKCLIKMTKIFYESNYKDCDCPLECSSLSFEFATSLSEFPSYKYGALYTKKAYINQNKTMINHVIKNLLSLNIYYDELSYLVIKENKKTEFVDMLASIGGNSYLFILN
jgi:hypothetical protein